MLAATCTAATVLLGTHTRLKPSLLVPLGIVTGVSVFVGVGTILLVVAETAPPIRTGAIACLGMLAIALVGRHRSDWRRIALGCALVVGGITAIVLVVGWTSPTRLTPDSLRYIAAGDVFSEQGAFARISRNVLLKRSTTTPLVHTLGQLDGRLYSPFVTPVVVGAGFVLTLIVLRDQLNDWRVPARGVRWLTGFAVAFILASNRALYDAFYVDSHGFVMVAFLVVVAGAFAMNHEPGWAIPVALAASLIVLARAEGPAVAALGLLPAITVLSTTRARVLLVLPAVLACLVWFGAGLLGRANPGDLSLLSDPASRGALVGLGLLAIAGATTTLERWPLLPIPTLTVAMLAVVLGISAIGHPSILVDAARATIVNMFGRGLWGTSWLVIVLLLVTTLRREAFPDAHVWFVPIVGYAILYWLLPFLRGGAYRIGEGDSGNRVLAHVFLVCVVYLGLAFGRELTSTSEHRA